MKKARLDGLWLLLLGGSVVLLLTGFLLTSSSPAVMQDFRVVYFPARCLIQHCDPYNESQVLRVYQAEAGTQLSETATDRQIVTRSIYPPTLFFFTVPFAMLPWGPAHVLWMLLTVGSLLLASILAWDLSAGYAPILAGALIGMMLANSEVLLVLGNPSGVVISFSVIAAWCFLRDRYIAIGILALAIGLAIKPQDAGFVWLYFLLAAGVYRRRALFSLLWTVILSLPGIVWASIVSPHWMSELRTNIQAFSVHGGITDPGPASTGTHGAGMMINLQTVLSLVRDEPGFYNLATWLIFAPLVLGLAYIALRFRSPRGTPPKAALLALAAVAPLTMLPVYHHLYDTKLLLLTVPACALLWTEGRRVGRFALAMNAAAFLLTGDVSWTLICGWIGKLHMPGRGFLFMTPATMQAVPVPLLLLAMSAFYLWIYAQRSIAESRTQS